MANNVRNLDEEKRTHDGNGPAQEIKDEVVSKTQQAREQVNEMTREASRMAEQATEKLQEISSTAYGMVKDRTGELGQAAGELSKEVTGVIRRYPMQSLAAGVALGFLLGKVLDVRRS